MSYHKKLTIISLMIVFILFILVIYFYYKPFLKSKTLKSDLSQEETKRILKLQEQVGEIIKFNDFGKCDEVKDEYYKRVCINNIAFNLAKEKQDISYCQKLDNKLLYTEDCERQILLPKAIDKEDIKVCSETRNKGIKQNCEQDFWTFLAIKKENINLCNNYLNYEEKIFCYDQYIFEKEFAYKKNNIKDFDCSKFQNKDIENDCKLYKENLDKRRPNFCYQLKSNLFVGYCMRNRF
jgi:hypothetical protein